MYICKISEIILSKSYHINPIALRMAKTLESFGHSECKRVKKKVHIHMSYLIWIYAVNKSSYFHFCHFKCQLFKYQRQK